MKAMIFAAGRGTRLGEQSMTLPKALVMAGGMTLLERAVRHVNSHGFNQIIVNTHHLAEQVEEEIASLRLKGFAIAVSPERDSLLDTGGGLFAARDFFDAEPFLLYNVDIISDIDLAQMYSENIRSGDIATLAMRNRPGSRFFLLNKAGKVQGWRNNSTGEEIIAGNCTNEKLSEAGFSGIHIVSPRIFDLMSGGIYSLTKLYLEMCGKESIGSYFHNSGVWLDVGTPENLQLAREMFG